MTSRAIGAVVAASIVILSTPIAARAAGNAERGQQIFTQDCRVCHSLKEGYQKDGPSLYKVWGRRAGSVPYFAHYKALKGADFTWNAETLDAWLAGPQGFTGKDTNMTFHLSNPSDRADVIAYLKSLR